MINRAKEAALTHEQLISELAYDPYTGIFTWRKTGKGRKNKIAGRLQKAGYREIGINGYLYRASRLAWFYMTFVWPPHEIDHKDLDKANNAFDNLREATPSQNLANRPSRNKIAKGVKKARHVYQARLGEKHLGNFKTAEDAAAAYVKAAVKKYGREFVRV
jgi:HNH endonuclease